MWGRGPESPMRAQLRWRHERLSASTSGPRLVCGPGAGEPEGQRARRSGQSRVSTNGQARLNYSGGTWDTAGETTVAQMACTDQACQDPAPVTVLVRGVGAAASTPPPPRPLLCEREELEGGESRRAGRTQPTTAGFGSGGRAVRGPWPACGSRECPATDSQRGNGGPQGAAFCRDPK